MILSIFFVTAVAAATGKEASAPPRMKEGKKWRIGYCESNRFVNYAEHLYALVRGLTALGWIKGTEHFPYASGQEDTRAMWEWLASHDVGPYMEFVGNAYYTYDGMSPGLRKRKTEDIIRRLNQKRDIDLMIAMGTIAGKLVADDRHSVPVMVFSTSNAVAAGIVKSVEKSGRDHVWAHMYPTRFKRQIEVFHDIFAFKRLGMVHEDSPAGRALAALDDAEALARERKFEIIRCFVNDNQTDKNMFFRETLAAHRKLAGEIDAMYMTIYPGSRKFDMLPALMEPFYEKKIPVFTQLKMEVQFGALVSVADADFMGIGLFGAEAIAMVLKGGSTRNLPQVYESTPYIVLNLEAAQKIGYRPPFDILLVADRIYRKIERP
jgi:ABC-type uncharacterized transport system substrate-binding protein